PARRSAATATTATRWRGWIWRPRGESANGSRRGCWATRSPAPQGMGDNGRMETKLDRIRSALQALDPAHLDVLDESHMHSRGLETHYKAVIASEAFTGKMRVRRHQAVYAALGPLMQEIHALALHAYTPDEWAAQGAAPDS